MSCDHTTAVHYSQRNGIRIIRIPQVMCKLSWNINTQVVCHLHGETGSSTVYANGKQKCLMVSSAPIVCLPFTQKTLIYQKRTRTSSTRSQFQDGGKELQMVSTFTTRIFWLEIFGLPFKTFRLFGKFSVRSSQKLSYHFNSDRNFLGKW